MLKLVMNIILARLLPFYESQLLKSNVAFALHRVMMAYTSSNKSRKLHISPIENYLLF